MSLQSNETLIKKLSSKKFRDAFVSSRVSNTLAFQIRAMRQERGLSQTSLAEKLGTSQNAICRLESPQYGKPSITTLKKLASLFDVGLAVWFVPFSEMVDRFTALSTKSVLVPTFDEDLGQVREAKVAEAEVVNLHSAESRRESQPSYRMPVSVSGCLPARVPERFGNLISFEKAKEVLAGRGQSVPPLSNMLTVAQTGGESSYAAMCNHPR